MLDLNGLKFFRCTHPHLKQLYIQHLKTLFAQFGIPDIIATDNGSCFVSSEFEDFLTTNGIIHWKSSPYHPSSNGLAEKAVQIVKNGLKK